MKQDVTESAKAVRAILKTTYPGIKFSVRVSRFSGNSSVEVAWTDGPTGTEVRNLTAHLKGWDNGFYNDYIMDNRSISREVMEAAAHAAADYYEVPTPKVIGDAHPYLEDMTAVKGFGSLDRLEPICDKVHRAAHNTSVYNVDLASAFDAAYPN